MLLLLLLERKFLSKIERKYAKHKIPSLFQHLKYKICTLSVYIRALSMHTYVMSRCSFRARHGMAQPSRGDHDSQYSLLVGRLSDEVIHESSNSF